MLSTSDLITWTCSSRLCICCLETSSAGPADALSAPSRASRTEQKRNAERPSLMGGSPQFLSDAFGLPLGRTRDRAHGSSSAAHRKLVGRRPASTVVAPRCSGAFSFLHAGGQPPVVKQAAVATPLHCSRCGEENRDTAKFCGACGEPLATSVSCVACGTQNPRGRRFCDECGGALETPRREACAAARAAREDPERLAGGRYQLQSFLGEGAKKRVHLARDTRL